MLFPNALPCNSTPSNSTSSLTLSDWREERAARGSGHKGECLEQSLLHDSQQVPTSPWLIPIFMLEMRVETYRVAQETDAGILTQVSKVSEFMNTDICGIYLMFPGWS